MASVSDGSPRVALSAKLYKCGRGFTGGRCWYKRWWVLSGHTLCYYTKEEAYEKQERPHRVVDLGGARVEDRGMERWNGKELYTLALHFNAFGSGDRETLQLASRSPEEAARWETALRRARELAISDAVQAGSAHPQSPPSEDPASLLPKDLRAIGHLPPVLRDVQELARGGGRTTLGAKGAPKGARPALEQAVEEGRLPEREEGPSVLQEDTAWRLSGLENGLRIFEDSEGTAGSRWAAAPCTKVAGRVRAPSHVVFKLAMDLGRSREQWDCTFASGSVLESLDGHTEVVHVVLRPLRHAWGGLLPSRPRDLVMTRYWRREEDGTYVILFRSTPHESCPPQPGYVRANVASGCVTISQLPGKDGKESESLVLYLLEMAPGGWMLPITGLPRTFQRSMLMSVAGIRDFFEQLSESCAANLETGLPDPLHCLLDAAASDDDPEDEAEEGEEDSARAAPTEGFPASPGSPPGTSASPVSSDAPSSASFQRALSGAAAASLARLSVAAYEPPPEFPGLPRDAGGSVRFCTWPPPKGVKGLNTWCAPAGQRFVVRSSTYLKNGIKCSAGPPIMSLVAVDWLTSDLRIDGVCLRPGGVAQRVLLKACDEGLTVFCVNLQVPGAKPYSIIFYFACQGGVPPDSVLGRFWHGTDAYRAPRFKLIPSITEGAWAVQRSVGTKPLIVGNALRTMYHGGGKERFLEVDVDIGSSSVANSVTRFVMVYLKTLVIDLGFLIESKSEAELPERLIGAIRVSHLDPDLAAEAPPAAA